MSYFILKNGDKKYCKSFEYSVPISEIDNYCNSDIGYTCSLCIYYNECLKDRDNNESIVDY